MPMCNHKILKQNNIFFLINWLCSLESVCVLIILIKNCNVFTYRKSTKQNNKKFRKTYQGPILVWAKMDMSLQLIIIHHIDFWIQIVLKKFWVLYSYCISIYFDLWIGKSKIHNRFCSYNNSERQKYWWGFYILYFEAPYCRFNLEIFKWTFLIPWPINEITLHVFIMIKYFQTFHHIWGFKNDFHLIFYFLWCSA